MKKPQFAERQYETAANIELARGAASPFVPTQPMETYLGIDAAADPQSLHAIWRILSVQIPRRVLLSPALWPLLPPQFHDQIPGRYCSLFVQFKRPVFQDNARAQYSARIGGPYFQVGITRHQQKALLQLQKKVRAKAVVRYASPAFWSRADFDRHDQRRQILVNSAFICPSRIKVHEKWMYAGASGAVVLNPDPEDAEGDTWEAVVAQMANSAAEESLRDHVKSLAQAIRAEDDLPGDANTWLGRLAPYGRFSGRDNASLIDLSVVALAAEAADSTWFTFLTPDKNWKQYVDQVPPPWWRHYRW